MNEEYLNLKYKNWHIDPWRTILVATKQGDLPAIQLLISMCNCVPKSDISTVDRLSTHERNVSGWQHIAELAAFYGHLHIIEYVMEQSDLNLEAIASIALDRNNTEIYEFSGGITEYREDPNLEDEEVDIGEPPEDPILAMDMWRFVGINRNTEDFMPQEPQIIDRRETLLSGDSSDIPGSKGWGYEGEYIDMYEEED